jgi:DNA polymerase-3 subunit gamma/tau
MYTIFIFCTTDPQKIPETIKNRVQRYTFNRIPTNIIKDRLAYICRQEGFTNYEEAVDYISKISDGGMRAAISFLDKSAGFSTDLNINNVLSALGNYSYETFFNLINYMIDGVEAPVLKLISDFYDEGNDLKLFVDQFLNFVMDVNKYSLFKTCDVTKIPSSMEDKLIGSTNFDNAPKYYSYVADKLLQLKNMLKNDNSPRVTIEIMLLQITRCA